MCSGIARAPLDTMTLSTTLAKLTVVPEYHQYAWHALLIASTVLTLNHARHAQCPPIWPPAPNKSKESLRLVSQSVIALSSSTRSENASHSKVILSYLIVRVGSASNGIIRTLTIS